MMKIAVVGVGAVGGYFGGRLAEAGQPVHFLARGETLQALRTQGLRVESLAGDFEIEAPLVSEDPSEIGPVDVVILGLKAWQVQSVAKTLGPLIGPSTAVLPLQNGVQAPEILAEVLGREHVLGGLCGIVAEQMGPGHIRHGGGSPIVTFGELDDTRSPRVEALAGAFAGAGGLEANIAPDIQVALWQKFMLICPWSGLGAITRAPAGVYRSAPETRPLLHAAFAEVDSLARALGVALPSDALEQVIAYFDSVPEGATASMQRDIMQGRPSELEMQNGAVVRLAEAAKVDTPVHRFIYHALIPMERRARGELHW